MDRTADPRRIDLGYRQIIERCHAHGIRVISHTHSAYSQHGEEVRVAVNGWIRAKGLRCVVDDTILRDGERPARVKAEGDSGDHIHPNDAGIK